MAIEHIYSFLVHPGKNDDDPPEIKGASVALKGKLFDLLAGIYADSATDCDIQIMFRKASDGSKQNPCRDLIIAHLTKPSLAAGRALAKRLQEKTDKRSKDGLFFVITGTEGNNRKILLSRFPTDKAILAEETSNSLTVEFLERVFMKSQHSYKAAVYEHSSLLAGFWFGQAVDKQINSRLLEASNYWIFDFLESEFRVTPAAGTRQLGAAIRTAAKVSSDVNVRSEIAAAVTLASNYRRDKTSIREFLNDLNLSAEAQQAVIEQLHDPEIADHRFKFDREEFRSQVAYRSVELHTGALLTAEAASFEKVFEKESLDGDQNEVRYSTRGRIVNEKLRKAPPQ